MSHHFRFLALGISVTALGFLLAGCSSSEPTATGPAPDAQSSIADAKVPESQRNIARQAAEKQAAMNAMRERDAAARKAP